MAQPNVVREPSMEEILASIRRIIESNDPGAGQSISASVPPVYAEDDDEGDAGEIHLTVDNDNAFAEGLDEPDAWPPEAPVPQVSAESRQVAPDNVRSIEERRSLSLADVAARVRAASDRQAGQRRNEPEHASVRSMDLRGATAPSSPAADTAMRAPTAVSSPVMDDLDEEPMETLSRVIQPLPEIAAVSTAKSAAPVGEYDVEAAMAADEETTQEQDDESALISMDTGDRVARSFGDLAAALDAGPRRSLDEIAQELLRPMLKEWLDDNLPTLVERLVREEIERVARGPRR